MSKYYTPEIEEFYAGFEYEVNVLEGTWDSGKEDRKWVKTSIDDNIHQLFAETKRLKDEPENIRVKYLDKEDIESLGFSIRSTSYGIYYIKNQYKIDYAWDKRLIISENNKMIVDGDFENQGNILFMGNIKNKSELKKLLKQLNVT